MDNICLLHNSSSEPESSTLFSGLPHVIDPQPQDWRDLRLFYLHLHRLVAHTLQPHCNSSVHTFGMGSNGDSFGFNWLLYGSRSHPHVSGSMRSGVGTVAFIHIVV